MIGTESQAPDFGDAEWLSETLTAIRFDYALQGFLYLGEGHTRVAFQTDDAHVMKIPLNVNGILDNEREAGLSRVDGKTGYIPYAECETVIERGIPLLRMELVRHAPGLPGELPEWTDFVDCGQVGWTQDGQLVAYDFA